jgi:sporulation and spore germination protein
MSRNLKITLAILGVAVVVGLLSLRSLKTRVNRLAEDQSSDEQARREVVAPPITTPTDVASNTTIFWASASTPDQLAPVQVQLPLSSDPTMRGKQVIQALIANAPSPAQRTLPADVTLLAFYVLPDGTAVADFSDALSAETPSGILSEDLTVNSIAQTLAANVPTLRRLKILMHGQEAEALAGHADLTGYFDLNAAPEPPAGTTAAAGSPASSLAPVSASANSPDATGTKSKR